MKIRNLIYSFLVAWIVSICLLMATSAILETRSVTPNIADYIQAVLLFGLWSFCVIAPVWVIVVVPLFFAAKKFLILQDRVFAGIFASTMGFAVMFLLMDCLPVDQKQRPIFCAIATITGFVSSMVLLLRSRPDMHFPIV